MGGFCLCLLSTPIYGVCFPDFRRALLHISIGADRRTRLFFSIRQGAGRLDDVWVSMSEIARVDPHLREAHAEREKKNKVLMGRELSATRQSTFLPSWGCIYVHLVLLNHTLLHNAHDFQDCFTELPSSQPPALAASFETTSTSQPRLFVESVRGSCGLESVRAVADADVGSYCHQKGLVPSTTL